MVASMIQDSSKQTFSKKVSLSRPYVNSFFDEKCALADHATFRGKGANTAWLDKLGLFPSLTLCNKTNFGYLQFPKYSVLYKMGICKKKVRLFPFS